MQLKVNRKNVISPGDITGQSNKSYLLTRVEMLPQTPNLVLEKVPAAEAQLFIHSFISEVSITCVPLFLPIRHVN